MASRKKAAPKNRSKARRKSTRPLSAGWSKNIIWILIAVVVVVFAVESMNLFHGETLKDFKVQYLSTITGNSEKCGPFNAWGVTPVGKDKIMVVDQGNRRVLVFDRKGNCLKSWGKIGSGPKEFREPSGATSDDKGNGYVMDTWNTAVKGFNADGKEILNINLTNGTFYGPRGIGFDGHNFIIADTGSHRVELCAMDGKMETSWGGFGKEPGQFRGLLDAVSDHKGNYLVADSENNRVQWLDQDGKVVKIFNFKANVPAIAMDKEGRFYVSTGTGDGRSCVKAYSLKDGYLGDLKDEKGTLVPGDRGLAISQDDVLMIAGGGGVALYQVPPGTP
jgi:sugar lactone lactonase YvrE